MTEDIYEIDTDFSANSSTSKKISNTWNAKAVTIILSGGLGIVVILVAYALNISHSSYKNASYDLRTSANSNPIATPKIEPQETSVLGKLGCKKTIDKTCNPVLLTKEGEVPLMGDKLSSLKLVPTGTLLVVYGITPTGTPPLLKNSKNSGTSLSSLIVTSFGNNFISPTLTYPLISLTPVPTITPSITPTITPTPTISDPANIKQIVNASPGNNGDTLTVIGYIVNANIGTEACVYLNQCDFSTFIVNQDPGIDRDTRYDVSVKASKDEKESDYILNQKVKFNAQVVVVDGVTTLEKLY